jgi:hypothetical protein
VPTPLTSSASSHALHGAPTDGSAHIATMAAVQAPHDTAAAMEDIHGVDVSWLHHSTRGE